MMKRLTAMLLAGSLTILALAAFASCKKKDTTNTNDDSASYTENTVVVDYLRAESKDADGKVQKDEEGNVIYDYFKFEAIDSTSTRLVSYRSEIVGTEGASMLQTYARHAVVIPETFGERTVTEIGEKAFYANSSLTGVKLPGQVEAIGAYAFALCSDLAALALPATVETIGEGAFYKCVSLATLTFAASSELTEIPANAFGECKSLAALTIPSCVETIKEGAFYGAESLQTLVLSEGVKSLGKLAFFNTKALTTLVLPASLTEIGDQNFYGSDALTAAGVTASGEVATAYVESMKLK